MLCWGLLHTVSYVHTLLWAALQIIWWRIVELKNKYLNYNVPQITDIQVMEFQPYETYKT
jgi:hypothetical protein